MDHENDYEDESWGDGDEYFDEDDEIAEVVTCPACGADVYEDAEQCPTCGDYIVHSASGQVWKNRPVWWVVLGLLGIFAVIMALTSFL